MFSDCKITAYFVLLQAKTKSMSQKAFYRMNPATGQYERVYPGAWQRIASSLRMVRWARPWPSGR